MGLHGTTMRWDEATPTKPYRTNVGTFGSNGGRPWIQAGGELVLPTVDHETSRLAWQWTRDLAREAGITVTED